MLRDDDNKKKKPYKNVKHCYNGSNQAERRTTVLLTHQVTLLISLLSKVIHFTKTINPTLYLERPFPVFTETFHSSQQNAVKNKIFDSDEKKKKNYIPQPPPSPFIDPLLPPPPPP